MQQHWDAWSQNNIACLLAQPYYTVDKIKLYRLSNCFHFVLFENTHRYNSLWKHTYTNRQVSINIKLILIDMPSFANITCAREQCSALAFGWQPNRITLSQRGTQFLASRMGLASRRVANAIIYIIPYAVQLNWTSMSSIKLYLIIFILIGIDFLRSYKYARFDFSMIFFFLQK